MKVSIIDAGHFDALTAYAAINTLRLDDMRPHIYRTHDGGKTWTEIVNGIPDGAPVNAVREDPKRKGLLFAGTEREVYVSFDDGDHWQSLRLNMPADVDPRSDRQGRRPVVGTHGRGFWILDDITPLRQIDATSPRADALLFKPQTALSRALEHEHRHAAAARRSRRRRIRPTARSSTTTSARTRSGPVTLEILDAAGAVVRHYSSSDPERAGRSATCRCRPTGTARRAACPRPPGCIASLWDMHYTPLPGGGGRGGLPIAAVAARHARPRRIRSGRAPGQYTVRLTVDGKTLHAAADAEDGPAREDAARRAAAAVHAVEGAL